MPKKILINKKKTLKSKKTTKKVVKKKRTKKVNKKISMEDIYSIINKVQIKRKEITFSASKEDAPVIENNMRDVDLKYDIKELKTKVVFTIFPSEYKYDDDITLNIDTLEDEIPDTDQIFG